MARGVPNSCWGSLTSAQSKRALMMSDRDADVMYLSLRRYHGGSDEQFLVWMESVVYAGTCNPSATDKFVDSEAEPRERRGRPE